MKTVEIKGTIVPNEDAWIYDWCGYDNTPPAAVKKAIGEAGGDDITFMINSGGGDVFAGIEICYMIQSYAGNTTADIAGLCASIATVIACGADKVRGTAAMQYMIHNVSCGAYGDYNIMDKTSQVLQNANKSISNIYRQKTGMTGDELLRLMDEETWLDADRAKELGFIDEIIGGSPARGTISISNSFARILDDGLKEKIRNTIKKPGRQQGIDKRKAELELLKLKGMKNIIC